MMIEADQEFESFWKLYPRKASKGDARKAWSQTASIRPPLPDLLAAVERGRSSADWHKADREGNVGAFIPYPASWLRAEGWENQYTISLSSVANGSNAAHRDPPQQKLVGPPTAEQLALMRSALSVVKKVG